MDLREESNLLTEYYLNQAGHGFSIFAGAPFQRGYGIGSFLAGLYRSVMPLLRKSGVVVGKEVLRGATSLLGDLENDTNIKTALRNRSSEVFNNLRKRAFTEMDGSGYNKNAKRRKTSQSSAGSAKKKTTKAKGVKKITKKITKKKKIAKKQASNKNKSSCQLAARRRDFFS